MRKFLSKTIAVFLAMILFGSQVFAGSNMSVSSEEEAYVNFDETEITGSFSEITDLVNYVSENDVTYADVENTNSSLLENVSSSSALALSGSSGEGVPFISPFLWGCVFNVVGILIVALTSDMDTDLIMKSVWGCVAGTVAYVGFWLVYDLIILGSIGYY
jgi:hypothetical protein